MASSLWQKINDDRSTPEYHFGTWRACTPTQTLRRITPLLPRAGITRLADVTGLDWIGIPIYQAIRPNSRNVSVSMGKGLTRAQAKVSALMESLESFHAEEILGPTRRATIRSMRQEMNYDPYALPTLRATVGTLPREVDYDPYLIPLGEPSLMHDDMPIDWIAATDLSTGRSTWVPKQLCELNFCVEERLHVPVFRATSNGLASGNTVTEALIHALCEIIERDSVWRNTDTGPHSGRRIVLSTVDSRLAQRLLERFDRAGMLTYIVDSSGPTGLPCFEVFLGHEEAPAIYYGAGCSPDRLTALVRALTEAAQTRVTYIAGSRDDVYRRMYHRAPWGPEAAQRSVVRSKPELNFRHTPTLPVNGMTAVLKDLVSRVRAMTGMSPMAVDLTRPEFEVPVLFVIAPGLHIRLPRSR